MVKSMRTTKIEAECRATEENPFAEERHIFHMVESGNNIILFPCYNGEVLRYENIHSFLEEWRLISKL